MDIVPQYLAYWGYLPHGLYDLLLIPKNLRSKGTFNQKQQVEHDKRMALGRFIISTFKTLEAVATKIGNGADDGTVLSSAKAKQITANQNAITSINTTIDSHSETIEVSKVEFIL